MRDCQQVALEIVAPVRTELQRRVLEQFKNGNHTADEVATNLGMSILSSRPRVAELVKRGLLTESGERRLNASGRPATVWTLKEDGQQLLPLTAHTTTKRDSMAMTNIEPETKDRT